jgi:hypothetical protein
MDVIGHQHIGMHCTAIPFRSFSKTAQIEPIVLVGKKTGRPVIASLNDVMRYSATLDTCASWHGLTLSLYQNRSISGSVPLIYLLNLTALAPSPFSTIILP